MNPRSRQMHLSSSKLLAMIRGALSYIPLPSQNLIAFLLRIATPEYLRLYQCTLDGYSVKVYRDKKGEGEESQSGTCRDRILTNSILLFPNPKRWLATRIRKLPFAVVYCVRHRAPVPTPLCCCRLSIVNSQYVSKEPPSNCDLRLPVDGSIRAWWTPEKGKSQPCEGVGSESGEPRSSLLVEARS